MQWSLGDAGPLSSLPANSPQSPPPSRPLPGMAQALPKVTHPWEGAKRGALEGHMPVISGEHLTAAISRLQEFIL